MTFTELGLSEQLLEGLEAMGFETATPIQEKAIPEILNGKDLIACAQTGTGKTAAFLLPILDRLSQNNRETIDTLILVPTRELAIQIDHQIEGLGYFVGASSLPIYGGRDGTSFQQEKKALSMGANIVVATPGRLIAHLNLGYVQLNDLRHLILDEADRMLDMGFIHDIQKITSYLPKKRQNLMFSATMPPKIRQFAKQILHNPGQINFAVSKPAEGILQAAYVVDDSLKLELLKSLLEGRKDKEKRILIFSSTKVNVKKITAEMQNSGLNAKEIHSDIDQNQREEMLRLFKNGSLPILVATDILARGIDVKGIDLVLNYDVPNDAEDYIHRIGRTARADTEGVAITFINFRDFRKFSNIEDLMEIQVRKLPLPPHIQEKMPERPTFKQRRNSRGYNGRSGPRKGRKPNPRGRNNRSNNRNRNRNQDKH